MYSGKDLLQGILSGDQLDNVFLRGRQVLDSATYIIALLNTPEIQYGYIVLGINSDRTVVSLPKPEEAIGYFKKLEDTLSSKPTIDYSIGKVGRRNVLIITVQPLSISQIPVKRKNLNEIQYIYIKDNKVEKMSPSMMTLYRSISQNVSEENQGVASYRIKFDDKKLIGSYLEKLLLIRPELKRMGQDELYQCLGLQTDTRKTIAFILSFCIYPQIFFPDFVLKLYTIGMDGKPTLLEVFDGSISTIYLKTVFKLKNLLGYHVYYDGNRLQKVCDFPIEVLEEVIYNALIHRDYSTPFRMVPISVYVADNYVNVISPGICFSTGTVDEKVMKFTRNPHLKAVNDVILNKDKSNSGFTFVFNYLRKHEFRMPLITSGNDEFSFTLYKREKKKLGHKFTIEDLLDFCSVPRTKWEIHDRFFPSKNRKLQYMMRKYILPLIRKGTLEFTNKEKPKSKNQKIVTAKDPY